METPLPDPGPGGAATDGEPAAALAAERRARLAAQAAGDELAAVLDDLPDGFFAVDREWRIIYVNPAAAQTASVHLGSEPDALLGRVFWDVVPAAVGTRFASEYARVMDERVAARFEEYFEPWRRWFEVRAYPTGPGISVYFHDATERRRLEAVVRERETWHGLLFESNPIPMWVFDPGTLQILDVNTTAVEHYGYSREEFLAMTLRDIRPEQDVPLLEAALSRAAGKRMHVDEVRHRTRDGRILHVLVTGLDVVFRERRARLAVAVDVTSRVQAEAALRESEERFRQLAENVRDVFWLVELDRPGGAIGRVLYVSPSFAATWGLPVASIYADSRAGLRLVQPEHEAAVEAALARAAGGEEADVEFGIHRRDGTVRMLWLRAFPVRNEIGEVYRVGGVTEDVTDRTRLEQQIRMSQRLEAVGRLAAGISHDFNNVLSAILGNAQLLEMELPEGAPLLEEVGEIRTAARRAATLVQQLLTFSRQQEQRPEVIAPGPLVDEVVKLLRRVIREDIVLDVHVAPDGGRVSADPTQLHQVLMNLAVNARDAMPLGGRLTIEVADAELTAADAARFPYTVRPGSYVRIRVSDTGSGMDAATQQQIFEPFFTTKPGGEGTGLGLATVYGIVKQSGGYIWVDSRPGGGSTFDVYLPRVIDAGRIGASAVDPATVRG